MDNQINNQSVKNPNEVLAEQIFQKLFDEGLISNDGKSTFIRNLSQGNLGDGDWKVALEQVLNTKITTNETSKT
jgi:hypothetical protein